jgi:hypothetical protein
MFAPFFNEDDLLDCFCPIKFDLETTESTDCINEFLFLEAMVNEEEGDKFADAGPVLFISESRSCSTMTGGMGTFC